MFVDEQYKLLDFGSGRRLERFGQWLLDRPAPVAKQPKQLTPEVWLQAHARFQGRRTQGRWVFRCSVPPRWTVAIGRLRFELKLTDFGHVGLFPEQAENWFWLEKAVSSICCQHAGKAPLVLNLFAYTGGSTLAAAAAGAEVVHLDAAKNVVAWARRNAELSQLHEAPIHWVVEDALKFVKRELRRGQRYDALILDPPSYGHGRRGEVWRLKKHLPLLLDYCAQLTDGQPAFMLLTCHTPGFEPERLAEMLTGVFGPADELGVQYMMLRAESGGELPSGAVVRWRRQAAAACIDALSSK